MTKPIIPDAALAQHVAIIAMTGGGKSYLARGIVEHLLDLERRVCIIDYTGVWYGLRSNPSGKKAAYPVVIFGGEHADVPLNEHAGPAIAKLVAAGNRPSIIDVDGMTVGAQQRFVTAFLEELYRINSKPLHLVIEEADEFAPQTSAPGAERMIGAVCRIFQRGRRKGFRAMAITQRPANVHKRVLTQCKTLIALQLNAPQDRGAVLDWIRGHADLDTGKRIVDDLPKLKLGEAYVWAPQQNILEKVSVPTIRTFDSMKAPEEGEDATPASWAEVDLDDVKAALADAVKEAEANDPAKLKAEIRRLTAEIARKPVPAAQTHDPLAVAAARQEGREDGAREGYAAGLRAVQPLAERLGTLSAAVSEQVDAFRADLRRLTAAATPVERRTIAAPAPVQRRATTAPRARMATTGATHHGNGADKPMPRAMLTALAQHPDGLTKGQVLVHTGYRSSGPVSACFAELGRNGWTEARAGKLFVTPDGLAALGHYDPLPTGEALREHLLNGSKCSTMEKAILRTLFDAYPEPIAKGVILGKTSYASSGPTSAAFARLVALGYAERRERGHLRAADEFFNG